MSSLSAGYLGLTVLLFAGWTMASHLAAVSGLSLYTLLWIAPLCWGLLGVSYWWLARQPALALQPRPAGSNPGPMPVGRLRDSIVLLALSAIPFLLWWSWFYFWVYTVLLLAIGLLRPGHWRRSHALETARDHPGAWAIAGGCVLLAVVLTLAVTRSDMDDSLYVAFAAFTAGHPAMPVLGADPMLGEANLPLTFPSYRFASFEILGGALALLSGHSTLEIMYVWMPAFWAVFIVVTAFVVARQLLPGHWLLMGVTVLLLMLLLGEAHRSPANFAFVRLFQGKAILASALVPLIYYYTSRWFSPSGRRTDLLLLGCTQIAAIGISNFGMLAGALAMLGALAANFAPLGRRYWQRLQGALVILLLPLPYLLYVLVYSGIGATMNWSEMAAAIGPSGIARATEVWHLVIGERQQYLVALALVSGPLLSRDPWLGRQLAAPLFLLFGVYLNPYLADFIAEYITLVYWRVLWAVSIPVFVAAALVIIASRYRAGCGRQWSGRWYLLILCLVMIVALPYHALRSANTDGFQGFAVAKVPARELGVAKATLAAHAAQQDNGRVLAPDLVASIIARFEQRPRLVLITDYYLDSLAAALPPAEYRMRRRLHRLANFGETGDSASLREALKVLEVTTIVVPATVITAGLQDELQGQGFRAEPSDGYVIWLRSLPSNAPAMEPVAG